jgi:hypothetical protein
MRHCPTEYPKKLPPLHACPRLGKLIVSADVALGHSLPMHSAPVLPYVENGLKW